MSSNQSDKTLNPNGFTIQNAFHITKTTFYDSHTQIFDPNLGFFIHYVLHPDLGYINVFYDSVRRSFSRIVFDNQGFACYDLDREYYYDQNTGKGYFFDNKKEVQSYYSVSNNQNILPNQQSYYPVINNQNILPNEQLLQNEFSQNGTHLRYKQGGELIKQERDRNLTNIPDLPQNKTNSQSTQTNSQSTQTNSQSTQTNSQKNQKKYSKQIQNDNKKPDAYKNPIKESQQNNSNNRNTRDQIPQTNNEFTNPQTNNEFLTNNQKGKIVQINGKNYTLLINHDPNSSDVLKPQNRELLSVQNKTNSQGTKINSKNTKINSQHSSVKFQKDSKETEQYNNIKKQTYSEILNSNKKNQETNSKNIQTTRGVNNKNSQNPQKIDVIKNFTQEELDQSKKNQQKQTFENNQRSKSYNNQNPQVSKNQKPIQKENNQIKKNYPNNNIKAKSVVKSTGPKYDDKITKNSQKNSFTALNSENNKKLESLKDKKIIQENNNQKIETFKPEGQKPNIETFESKEKKTSQESKSIEFNAKQKIEIQEKKDHNDSIKNFKPKNQENITNRTNQENKNKNKNKIKSKEKELNENQLIEQAIQENRKIKLQEEKKRQDEEKEKAEFNENIKKLYNDFLTKETENKVKMQDIFKVFDLIMTDKETERRHIFYSFVYNFLEKTAKDQDNKKNQILKTDEFLCNLKIVLFCTLGQENSKKIFLFLKFITSEEFLNALSRSKYKFKFNEILFSAKDDTEDIKGGLNILILLRFINYFSIDLSYISLEENDLLNKIKAQDNKIFFYLIHPEIFSNLLFAQIVRSSTDKEKDLITVLDNENLKLIEGFYLEKLPSTVTTGLIEGINKLLEIFIESKNSRSMPNENYSKPLILFKETIHSIFRDYLKNIIKSDNESDINFLKKIYTSKEFNDPDAQTEIKKFNELLLKIFENLNENNIELLELIQSNYKIYYDHCIKTFNDAKEKLPKPNENLIKDLEDKKNTQELNIFINLFIRMFFFVMYSNYYHTQQNNYKNFSVDGIEFIFFTSAFNARIMQKNYFFLREKEEKMHDKEPIKHFFGPLKLLFKNSSEINEKDLNILNLFLQNINKYNKELRNYIEDHCTEKQPRNEINLKEIRDIPQNPKLFFNLSEDCILKLEQKLGKLDKNKEFFSKEELSELRKHLKYLDKALNQEDLEKLKKIIEYSIFVNHNCFILDSLISTVSDSIDKKINNNSP